MELNIQTDTIVPSSVLTQYTAVGADGVATAATGDFVMGIVRTPNKEENSSCEIVTRGDRCYAMVGAVVAAETLLTGGANGRLVAATLGTHQVYAVALEAASAAGDVIEVKLL